MTRPFVIPQNTTRKEALALAKRALVNAGITTAALDARLIVTHALGIGMAEFLAHDDILIDENNATRLETAISRRAQHESVARITGVKEFWGLPFRLSADTLEPRPDTETLVEAVLDHYPDRLAPLRFLDLGTGTGCILIALLSEFPNATATGVDISPDALATAQDNAEANGVITRATFVQSDWLTDVTGTFDVIVSNPPYIRSEVMSTLTSEVRDFDPTRALDGGTDGLDAYRRILADCPPFLRHDGSVFFEIGFDQEHDLAKLMIPSHFNDITFRRDLAGHVRVAILTCGQK